MNSINRTTTILDLEVSSNNQIQDLISNCPPEQFLLRCTSDRQVDIGSLCYRIRSDSRKIPKQVELSSFCANRARAIRVWCAEKITQRFGSGYTLYGDATQFIRFVDWCDENGQGDLFSSPDEYKKALNSFSIFLLIATQDKRSITAFTSNRYQSIAISSAYIIFPGTPINFISDLPIISSNSKDRKQTPTPSSSEMSAHLTPYRYLFDGLSDFVLCGTEFPSRIPFMETEARIIPAVYKISTPKIWKNKRRIAQATVWNYEEGRINTLAECLAASVQTPNQVTKLHSKAVRKLEKANANLRHPIRIWLACLAQDAFISHFVANTAINEAPLRNLLWSDDYTLEKSETAGFVVIKQRASGAEQNFEIHKSFIKDFRKFLKLRAYLTNGIEHPYLFVNFERNTLTAKPIKSNTINLSNATIRGFLDPEFVGLSYKKLRKYKSVFLLGNGFSVGVVSGVMQSSPNTIVKHYAGADEKTAIDEISAVLTLAHDIFEGHSALPTPASACGGGKPEELANPPEAYEPDCRNFVGCIYCKKFRLHADENSLRKILSMRWVTSEYLSACVDIHQFHSIHGKAIVRIDAIVAELERLRPELKPLVGRINSEIQEKFQLTEYWNRLYNRLIQIKVLK